MKKILKKTVISILLLLLLVILSGVGLIHFFGDKALKAGIETAATKALNVGVAVEEVSFSILGGTVDMRNLVINNPAGYQYEHLLELGSMHIACDIKSLLSDTVKIKEMKFDNMMVVIEQKGFTNNLKEVLNALLSKDTAEEKAGAKNLLIEELEITNVKVKVKLLPIPGRTGTLELTLAPIRMSNLGSDDKLSAAKLSGKILSAIAVGISKEGADLLPKEITGPINDVLQNQGKVLIDTTKEVFDTSRELGKDVLEGGKDLGKGVGDALKGLFGGKKKE